MDLIRKYQRYRARFKADFLRVGLDQGHSLPADARKNDSIHFGDATVFLGWHIGVLATEHFLLQKGVLDSAVLNPSDTLRELYFALKALERLMRKAPDAFESLSRQHRDEAEGFFIRDDVTVDLKHQFGVEGIASDFIADDRFQKEESQDQLIHLLLGLALVKRFIPESVCVQGTFLVSLVSAISRQNLHLAVCDKMDNKESLLGTQKGRQRKLRGFLFLSDCGLSPVHR